ncbi:MAG: CHC2 zinc finger domain-containing protein [Armatimonadota bacterium]
MYVGQEIRDFIDIIRDRALIEEVVGAQVKLRGGSRPTGICPFHNESGASFTVYPEQNRWKCFGCGKGGSVFDFVMLTDGVEFWEAACRLGERFGVPVPELSKKDAAEVKKQQSVTGLLGQYAVKSHELLMRRPEALAYLKSRGITEESIKEYQIGYGAKLSAKHEIRLLAIDAGLISVNDGREYELMKGRITFPIIRNGRVVNMTGRLLPDPEKPDLKAPKYLSLANKGSTPLRPMNSHRLREKEVHLVEGAIDCILLEQAGYPASATVSAHFDIKWLPYCGKDTNFFLCYDADPNQAGQTANEKIGRILFDSRRPVSVVEFPLGDDPASYVQANGGEAFKTLRSKAKSYISYMIGRLPAEDQSSADLERNLRSIYELLQIIDRGIRGRFIKELGLKCKITQGDLRHGFAAYQRENAQQVPEALPNQFTEAMAAAADDGRPVIYADDEDLLKVTQQCWDAVIAANASMQYFKQGGVPVRLKADDNGALTAQRWNVDIARHELVEIVNWRRTIHAKSGEFDVVATPRDVVFKNMMTEKEIPLPILSRITEVPVFAPDGSLQTEPGYHEASKTFYVPPAGLVIPEVNQDPDERDMVKAMELFEDVVCDFPFVDNADRAHAFALWLLPFVRDMIPGPTPLHLIEAPSPGSGKGLLMNALVIPAVGTHVGSVTQASDEDEWRKRLTAVIMKGQQVVMLDNITRMLDSGTLASALTQIIWEDRLLGRNESVDIPVRCIWVCTANNPVMSTEIARRCIRIRIDPKQDMPWRREQFRHADLNSYVAEHRGDIIWAALTICRGWVVRGMRPYSGKVLGSYEQWSRVLGGIAELCNLGGKDGFLGNLLDLYEQADLEGQMWRQFVHAWWEKFQDQVVSASDLFEIAKEGDLFNFGKTSEHSQRISFGRKLGQQRDRVIGDFRVLKAGEKNRAIQWVLQKVGADGTPIVLPVSGSLEEQFTPVVPEEEEDFEWEEDGLS